MEGLFSAFGSNINSSKFFASFDIFTNSSFFSLIGITLAIPCRSSFTLSSPTKGNLPKRRQ